MEAIRSAVKLRGATRPPATVGNPPAEHSVVPMELKGSNCPELFACRRLGPTNPKTPLDISVVLKRPHELPVELRQPMTRTQMGRYGATRAQITSIEKFAHANHLSVTSVDASTRTIKLRGTVQSIGRAFDVQLNQYEDADGTQFRGYLGNLKMPANAASHVEGVFGLENRPLAKPHITPFQPRSSDNNSPVAIANLYHFPRGTDGSGQTIGIIELAGGYNEADIKNYFQKLGIAAPQVTSVSVDGGANKPTGQPNGPDGEVALDIDVAGAVAPRAKIVVYFANNTSQGFLDAVNQAAHDKVNKPNVLSISWGSPETRSSDASLNSFSNVLQEAAAMGVNVFCATGDHGSVDGDWLNRNVADFPASSPWSIGTGGTQLNSAHGQKISETTWNDTASGGGAGGGGVSRTFTKPSWQPSNVPPSPGWFGGGRGVPDVAGEAAPNTGYDVLVDGQEGQFGGTSAVAPLYAALAARLAQAVGAPLGYLNPFFYQHPGAFNDITQGTNGGYSAGPGWDAVTGLGSPDGEKLLAALKARQA